MSGSRVKALVLTGDGINCENETAQAFELAGFAAEVRHLNDVIVERVSLDDLSRKYSALALPGGFSFGDDLGSGRVLALKIRHGLGWNLRQYAERGGMVIGICNGFQALIRMGLFGAGVSITHNRSGKFMDQWVRLHAFPKASSPWLKDVGKLELPVRHGEGRLIFQGEAGSEAAGALQYETDLNGSHDRLAGLCDSTGRIFGLMPHPEAFVRWTAHPEWTAAPERAREEGDGLKLFRNAYREVKGA